MTSAATATKNNPAVRRRMVNAPRVPAACAERQDTKIRWIPQPASVPPRYSPEEMAAQIQLCVSRVADPQRAHRGGYPIRYRRYPLSFTACTVCRHGRERVEC